MSWGDACPFTIRPVTIRPDGVPTFVEFLARDLRKQLKYQTRITQCLGEWKATDVKATSATNEDIEAARYGLWVRFRAVSSLLK